jgi:hypothetical protein
MQTRIDGNHGRDRHVKAIVGLGLVVGVPWQKVRCQQASQQGTLAYLWVEISSRVLLLLSGVGVGSIVVLDLSILVRNGLHGLLWSSLLPWHSSGLSFSAWIIGLGLAFGCIAGSEAAVFLAEEAGADKRMVGRAVIGCVSVVAALPANQLRLRERP